LAVVEENEHKIKREGVCAASLPTTMGITAGFLAQATLKYLLDFGDLSYVLGYNAKKDFFSNYIIRPNPECKDKNCILRQQEKAKLPESELLMNKRAARIKGWDEPEKVEKSENEWGIEIVSSNETETTVTKQEEQQPTIDKSEVEKQSLEDLMAKFKNM